MSKKSKYDTDPLDADVALGAAKDWGEPVATSDAGNPTQPAGDFGAPQPDLEATTQQFEKRGYTSYPSVMVAPMGSDRPAPVQSLPVPVGRRRMSGFDYATGRAQDDVPVLQPATWRIVRGVNMPEALVLCAPYIPFYVGTIAAVIELFVLPREETKARFHASQGLALQLMAFAVNAALSIAGGHFEGAKIASSVFTSIIVCWCIVSIVRIWKGRPNHIAPLDDLRRWLDEVIPFKGKSGCK